MDRNLVMVRPNATRAHGSHGPSEAASGGVREREKRTRYTTQLQRRGRAHVTAEIGAARGAADLDLAIAMLLQHALETTGARRVTFFRPEPMGQRWHAATVLDDRFS